ncbi:hypothetical protein EYR36_001167 [Pleurotus pulmonarius]|nr:hypothetical protein EYR36_004214 [Pleurotus pulmonarius]KAF4579357.1 hypothetical protein EYR36_001167 [Pleurotus pulmonarius]KAF4603312.1 hypothetical protein EYR38_003725 [Pleurotus pulmonarius]
MSVTLGFSYAHLLSLPIVFQAPNMSICAPSNINFLWAIWIPSAVFESVLAVFVLWVAGKHMTFTKGLSSCQDKCGTAIWTVLLRDSILYPLITVSLYITNAILWSTLPPELVQLPEAAVSCAACVLGSRLVLNLRETYYTPFTDEVNIASEPQSDLELNTIPSPDDDAETPMAPARAHAALDDVENQ